MNESEHTFPLPPTAAHLLDEVEEQLQHQPWHLKTADYARSNPWALIGVAAAIGLVAGACVRRARLVG